MSDYKLGIIGAGNMAEAILRGVIAGNFLARDAIVVSEPNAERRMQVADALQVTCVEGNDAPARCARVLLAVKPQAIADVLDEIAPVVDADATVVSIVAGVTASFIDGRLGGRGRIVRVMPNTPMLVGCGMSAVSAGPRATDDDVQWTRKLFGTSGKAVVVDEGVMDAVTAVSGSGPAYFFYLIEAMIAAGVAEGLDEKTASLLAAQTCAGAAKLLLETAEPPEGLRARVTSPGGTTERAISTLESAEAKQILIEAIRAAAERSRELGK
jgi:pyrroline-5-carboxylate reductase